MTGQDKFEIKADVRFIGKHFSRALRKNRQVPAVLYGPKVENKNLSISESDAVKYGTSKFENTIFTLSSTDKEINGTKVLRKATTIHPVSRRPVHIDYYAVDMQSVVRVNIPVKYIGKPEGLMAGGVVQEIRHEVEVECLPSNIPPIIELDINKMQLGDVLHASDIQLPANVKLMTAPEIALVSCAEIKAEEIKVEVPTAATPDAAAGATAAAAAPAAAPAKDKK